MAKGASSKTGVAKKSGVANKSGAKTAKPKAAAKSPKAAKASKSPAELGLKPAPLPPPFPSRKPIAGLSATGKPQVGELAPEFALPADDGSTVTLKSLRGKNIVLYFYPKDDTPGCTVEALDFTALKPRFDKANTVVLGISKDTVAKHCKFRDKHGLTVRLLSDEDGVVLEAYGVWAEKSLYGRKFMGINRTTFLIDAKGKIASIWPKVKVKGHAEDVLAAAKDL